MADDLSGRVALVTGGGGGIGRAIASHLAARGAAVAVSDLGTSTDGQGRTTGTAQATATDIAPLGGRVLVDASDISDREAVNALASRVRAELGPVDIVVNTAGLIRNGDLTTYDEVDWDRHQRVHIDGHLHLLDTFEPEMHARGRGRFVFFTSGSGLLRYSSQLAAYGAGKNAIASLVWRHARRLAPGVTLNGVAPLAATRMHGSRPTGRTDAAVWSGPDAMPTPESIAPVVAAIARSSHNGTVWFTNGAETTSVRPPHVIERAYSGSPDDGHDVLDAVMREVVVPAARAGRTTGTHLPRVPLALFAEPSSA